VLAYVNGQYIPADRPALAVNDRSFMYGDGLFETIRITNGQPFLWREHLERLQRGAEFLKIRIPLSFDEIQDATRHLLAQNDTPEGVVRIHLSRGASDRGYGLPMTAQPIFVITTHKTLHAPAQPLKIITSSVRVLADDPLTQHKTANRLPNILARMQADAAGADEALLLNNHDQIAEASAANVFILRGRELITPPLTSGALAGTTRAYLLKSAAQFGFVPSEAPVTVAEVLSADGVYLTSAHWLITPVVSLDGVMLKSSLSAVKPLREQSERAALGL
jgi:branched-chain amino acid aminotransferase